MLKTAFTLYASPWINVAGVSKKPDILWKSFESDNFTVCLELGSWLVNATPIALGTSCPGTWSQAYIR